MKTLGFLYLAACIGVLTSAGIEYSRTVPPATKDTALYDFAYSRTTLTWKNIDYWLWYFEVDCMEVVKAQIILESDSLRSRLATEQNNLFGMGLAHSRPTSAHYERNGYAGYTSYIESIKDIKYFQMSYFHGGDYFEFIRKCGYAEDSLYIPKLKRIWRRVCK